MGQKADEYRQKAEEADRLFRKAEEAGQSLTAETYRDVAKKWRDLAEMADRWGL